jgi:hypothetical protein
MLKSCSRCREKRGARGFIRRSIVENWWDPTERDSSVGDAILLISRLWERSVLEREVKTIAN